MPAPAVSARMPLTSAATMSVTRFLRGQEAKTILSKRFQGFRHVFLQGHIHLDILGPEAIEGPATQPSAQDRVHRSSSQVLQGLACTVDVVRPFVPHHLEVPVIRVDEGEVGSTSEVVGRRSRETPIVKGRYAYVHDGSSPILSAEFWTTARITFLLPDFRSRWTVPLDTPMRSPAPS